MSMQTCTSWSTATRPMTPPPRPPGPSARDDRLDMVFGARVTRCAGVPPGPPLRNRLLTGWRARCSATRHGHPLRLPRVFAPFRAIVPGAVEGFRDRNQLAVHALVCACPSAKCANPLRRAPRDRQQAQYLARRLAHPAHDRPAREKGTSLRVLRLHRQRARVAGSAASRSSSNTLRPASRRAFPRPCCPPLSCWSRS